MNKQPVNRLSVWGKIARKGKGKEGREPVDKHLRPLFRPLVIILPIICEPARSLSVNQFRARVTPLKINGK